MRILYHSAAPWIGTGYGTCTEEIAPRLHNGDHEVAIQTLSSVQNSPIWWHGDELDYELSKKMRVYDSKGPFGLKGVGDNYEDFDADFLFTHFDTWMEPARKTIPSLEVPYASYVIVDHDPAPNAVVEQVNNAHTTIAMSKYAKRKLEEKGIRPRYIPHGVNTDVYEPLDDEMLPSEIAVQDELGKTRTVNPQDRFIVGMVAANHGDRKNIPNHMEAFKYFLDDVDDEAILYIHTKQNTSEGYDLESVRKEIGIPVSNIIWPSDDDYGEVGNEYLNAWYNTFDIMLNVSMGESWGLTITEAQAAGTPCIVTDFTSMPEQLGVDPNHYNDVKFVEKDPGDDYNTIGVAPHGIIIMPDAPIWREKVAARQWMTRPKKIFKAMEYYYNRPDLIEEHGEKAREFVVENYDWENCVIPKFREMFSNIEDRVTS